MPFVKDVTERHNDVLATDARHFLISPKATKNNRGKDDDGTMYKVFRTQKAPKPLNHRKLKLLPEHDSK